MSPHTVAGNRILAVLAVVVLWLVFLDFPALSASRAGPALDPSWEQALGYFLKHRFQAGVDYIFSYGPLGCFYTRAYEPDLLGAKYVWELGLKLLMAVVIVRAAWCIPRPDVRALFLVIVFFLPDHPDVLHPFFILLIGLAGLGTRRPSLLFLAIGAAALALLALVKFNLSMFALAALAVLCLSLASRGRPLAALLTAVCFVLSGAAAWLLTGQELANFPRFVHAAREVSEGYVEAMGTEGEPAQLVHALAVAALLLAALATYGYRPLVRLRPLLLVGLLGLSLFLEWKHSFVRQGSHVMNFFAFAALLPFLFLIVLPADRPSRWRLALASGALVLALVGRFAYDQLALTPFRIVTARLLRVPDNAWAVRSPAGLRERLEADRKEWQERWALPRVRSVVGASTIDLISCEQEVLFLNDLHYRPRPLFQSYKAYTPELLTINARFYESERAPAFVLLALAPIDNRLPASEDGPALLEIFRRYRPVLVEKGYLLLQRQAEPLPSALPGAVLLERTIRFGEEVDLGPTAPGETTLALTLRYSTWGRLRNSLFRPAPVFLRARTESGSVSYRLIPGLAEGGFLLNPFLEDDGDVLRLYEGSAGKRITSFTITGRDGAPAGFEDAIHLAIREWLPGARLRGQAVKVPGPAAEP